MNTTRKVYSILIALLCLWTVLILIGIRHERSERLSSARQMAMFKARTVHDMDIMYRRWAAANGGVYGDAQLNRPNPWLKDIPERDIETPSGRKLTLINPAHMTRQVHEIASGIIPGMSGHITSLSPIRPQNAPDAWEKAALESFEHGVTEVGSFDRDTEGESARYIRAMVVEKSCLSCHADHGYREGEIRGGVSIAIDTAPFLAEAEASMGVPFYAGCFAVWVAGGLLLFFGFRRARVGVVPSVVSAPLLQAFERIHETVVLTDADGVIQYVNPAFEKTTGYTAAEAIGQNPKILKSGIQEPGVYKALWDTILTGQTWKGRLVNRAKDGTHFAEEAEIQALRDASGAISHFVAIKRAMPIEKSTDISPDQAQRLEAIGRLTSGLAHDFNNQLSGVLVFAEMLETKVSDDKGRYYVEQIVKGAESISELIRKLLSHARKGAEEIAPVNMHRLIGETISLLRHGTARDIEIRHQLGATSFTLNGNASLLRNAILNLGINACDAMDGRGVLTLTTSTREVGPSAAAEVPGRITPGLYLEIGISDTGTGIPPEIIDRIFEPYFTTKPEGKGTGQGLAQVQNAVTSHQGTLSVKSSFPGGGTQFTILLPLMETGDETPSGLSSDLHQLTGQGIVMVVDDEKFSLNIFQRSLKMFGYDPRIFVNCREAVSFFEKHQADVELVITDQQMPATTGVQFARELRQIRPTVKILFTSGTPPCPETQAFIDEGRSGFLAKPMRLEALARQVKELIDRS